MIKNFINDSNFLNIYRFGSHVYGTNNEFSDEDFVCIVGHKVISEDINIHIYSKKEFQDFLNNHDIQALEMYFLPDEFKLKEAITFQFELDKSKLRHSISTVANGAWVKGKKKLLVQADYNKLLAIKSIFHSLRILDYGIQIATKGKISDYASMNKILFELFELAKKYDHEPLWNKIEDTYKATFNAMKSTFVALCPKGYNKNDVKRNKLVELLKAYEIGNQDLVNEIYDIFVKD